MTQTRTPRPAHLPKLGLTDEVLYAALEQNPGITSRKLAELLGYTKSYVKNRLGDLLDLGWVYYERKGRRGFSGYEILWYP